MIELAKLIPPVPNSLRFPVNYDEGRLRHKLQHYIDIGLDLLEKVDLPARDSYRQPYGRGLLYERDFFRILNEGFYANSLLFKHGAYAREQEYRLLINGRRDSMVNCDHHRLRERKGEIVGYLDLPIRKWGQPGVLSHVRVGPAAPSQLEDQLRVSLTALSVPLPPIDRSSIPYRSIR
jgi:hypothetical protein